MRESTDRRPGAPRRAAVAVVVAALGIGAGAGSLVVAEHRADVRADRVQAAARASARAAAAVDSRLADTAVQREGAARSSRTAVLRTRQLALGALRDAQERARDALAASRGEVAEDDEAVRGRLADLLEHAEDDETRAGAVEALRALAAQTLDVSEDVDAAHRDWLALQATPEPLPDDEPDDGVTAEPDPAPTTDRCTTTYDGPAFFTSAPTEGGDGSNGRLPESMLTPTSWGADSRGTRYWLRTDATAALERLNRAFRAEFGHDLDLDLTYRDYATQVAMREALGSIAAEPGTSRHGTGVALDVPELPCEYGWDTPQRQWLLAQGPSYGWVQPSWALEDGGNPEYWHYEFVG
ncbi:M15 family metallopeptidase [Cellulomonas sp. DKR-3]|uniref:M15 family metallopeptidase n=1 Tax=Cellulomonas fulva TaxID=2835530 RepID=A0ABS5TVW3_9CELL|nr:M15 family metallopeptidase [Cellulomonas fulva]MBT0993247.1 M15 family metallopeptidase [Cellulomonas fulva]